MAVSIMAAIFLVLLYIVIFTFSEQDGNSSGHLSHELTKWLVEGYEKLIHGSFSEEIRNGWISYWEHPVRKLAHFSEYAVMAVLIFLVLNPFGKKGWKKNLLIVSWVFVSAALDEWHQTFV
ncbi:MAG: VanZ family protein, partial [Lachnospiraceae bacterium]|nr:VanZ family protein [Lachnospiraceae bacterium]